MSYIGTLCFWDYSFFLFLGNGPYNSADKIIYQISGFRYEFLTEKLLFLHNGYHHISTESVKYKLL